jgi:hypothetical protein
MLAQSKAQLAAEGLHWFEGFVPPQLIARRGYEYESVTGTLNIKIKGANFQHDSGSSLVIQVLMDSWMSPPMKLKRRGGKCELSETGVTIDCKAARSLELLVFDKSTTLLGFLFLRLSWLTSKDSLTVSNIFRERLCLVPFSGTIDVDIHFEPVRGTLPTPKEAKKQEIQRQKVIKKTVVTRLGHEFVSDGQGALLLKCAHCQDMIYTSISTFCRKCRLTCHKDCAGQVYVRCIVDPKFREYEDLTTALMKQAKPHYLERVSVKTPCFCAHCGHLIPITATATESFRCTTCGIHLHETCDTYVPPLCGLSREDAMRIVQIYAKPEKPIPDIVLSSRWADFSEGQFEHVAVIGKGNFGKVMLSRHRETGRIYALKILKKANIFENDERDSIVAERYVFAVNHEKPSPFLTACHGIFQNAVQPTKQNSHCYRRDYFS